MNTALRVLREELNWLEAAHRRAFADLENPRIPEVLAQQMVDRLELEMLEIDAAITHLSGRMPRLRSVDERPPMELELFE